MDEAAEESRTFPDSDDAYASHYLAPYWALMSAYADPALGAGLDETEGEGDLRTPPLSVAAGADSDAASCPYLPLIGRLCGHCPSCPPAVIIESDSEDEAPSRRRRRAVQLAAPPKSEPPPPPLSARKTPPRPVRRSARLVGRAPIRGVKQ